MGITSKREKRLLLKHFPHKLKNHLKLCRSHSIAQPSRKRKSEFCERRFLKRFCALAKNPLFFANYIYFIDFFFTLIKEKSGKVGKNARNRCGTRVCGFFKSGQKPGKNPLFLAKSVRTSLQNRPNFRSCPKKVGRARFSKAKVGRDFRHRKARILS